MATQVMATPLEATLVPSDTKGTSQRRQWAGRILTGLTASFLVMDGGMKLFKPPFVVQATVQMGYPESAIVGTGIVLLAYTLLYLIPRFSILGAVLLTGYLGGAVATNVRAAQPMFNTVFPVIVGCIVWGGLWLREARLVELLPLKRIA